MRQHCGRPLCWRLPQPLLCHPPPNNRRLPLATPVQWKHWRDSTFAVSTLQHRISEDTARTSTDGALCVGGFQSNTSAKSPLTNRETVSSRLTCPLALH